MSQTIAVNLIDDNVPEANETLTVAIFDPKDSNNNPLGAVESGQATVTIVDDEQSIWSVETSATDVDAARPCVISLSRSRASPWTPM